MLNKDFVPKLPFEGFKWKWASVAPSESINDPVILLGVLFRMNKLEGKYKYSSDEFQKELAGLEKDIQGLEISFNLTRTPERNLIRNSGQYWKAVGLIPADTHGGLIQLTDFGKKVATQEISQTEFAAITVRTFTLPNYNTDDAAAIKLWKAYKIKIRPLHLILNIMRELGKSDKSLAYLKVNELIKVIIPLSGCKAELIDYVNFVKWYRNGEINVDMWANCCPSANDDRMAREMLLFLSNYGYVNKKNIKCSRGEEEYYYNYDLDDEISAVLSDISDNETVETALKDIKAAASELERKRVKLSSIRPNQAKFRKDVLEACGRCIITNVTLPEVLEAAHIKPFKYNGEDTIANGFAMRTDIHTLFDTGHLRISDKGEVYLSSRARMDYGASIPPYIVVPNFTNKDFLRWRWENYNGV